jgi:hypothetical protein
LDSAASPIFRNPDGGELITSKARASVMTAKCFPPSSF